jgi:sec-independent protein translocase protein TatB
MQMFGVGALELMVILILAVLVVGPDRLPQVAADIAQWIRRARVYANHLSRDFNEVVGELEKEVGASREDWKEIAGVVSKHTGAVGSAVTSAASALDHSLDAPKPATNGNAASEEATPLGETPAAANGNGNGVHDEEQAVEAAEPEAEKAWYETDRPVRRRSRT